MVPRRNIRGAIGNRRILGASVAVIILGTIFAYPSASAFTINFTAQDPANLNNLQSNSPPISFNVHLQVPPSETLIVNEVRVILDGNVGAPLRFSGAGVQLGTFDSRVALEQGTVSNQGPLSYGYAFPSFGGVGQQGYSNTFLYSYSVVSSQYGYAYFNTVTGQGVIGPVVIPYVVKIFPNQLPIGPHTVKVQIINGVGNTFSSGDIAFSIGGAFGTEPTLSMTASPPSVVAPPTGTTTATLTLNSINSLHTQNRAVEMEVFGQSGIALSVSQSSFTFNTQTKTLTLTVTTTNASPGSYNLFVKAKIPSLNKEIPLNIPLNIVSSGQPTLLFNPQTANPGSSVSFDGFNFQATNTVTLSTLTPGGTITIPTVPSSPQVDSTGHVQGTINLPTDFSQFGTFPVTITASPSGQTAQAFLSVFSSGTADFILNVSPTTINNPPVGSTEFNAGNFPIMEVSFTKVGSFNSPVTVSVSGLPSGVTTQFDTGSGFSTASSASISPPSFGSVSSPVRVKFIHTSSTPFGFFPVSIQGQSGSLVKFVQANLSVPPSTTFGGTGTGAIGVLSLNPPAGSAGTAVNFNGIVPSSFSGKTVTVKIAEDATTRAPATVSSSGSFSGTFTAPSSFTGFGGVTVSSPTGRFPIKAFVQDGPTLFADFEYLSSTAGFRASISPEFLPPVIAGSNSDTVTVTATGVAGKAGGTVTINVNGLPPNMQVSFGGGAFGTTTTTTMSLASGGTASKTIQFKTSSNTPPGPVPIFVEVKGDSNLGNQVFGFPLNFGVMPSYVGGTFGGTSGIASVLLSKTVGSNGDDITVTAAGFTPSSTLTIIFGGLDTDPSFTATADSNGSASVPIKVPSSLASGTYPVRVKDTGTPQRFGSQPFTIVGGTETFSVLISPSFLPPIEQDSEQLNAATATIQVFSGKSVSGNSATVKFNGLPPGVTAKFGSGSYSANPQTTVSLSSGQTTSVSISFKVEKSAPPGPINAFIEVVAGTEKKGQPLSSGVVPKANFLAVTAQSVDFGSFGTGGPGAVNFKFFSVGTVFVNPKSMAAGDIVTVTANGFTPSTNVSMEIFGPSGAVTVSLPSGTQFDSSGSFSQQVKIPSTLTAGQYFLKVSDGTNFADTEIRIAGTSDVFFITVSPEFLPPTPQGTDSQPISITAKALSGKNAGTVTLSLGGLPQGVTGSFNGGSFSTSPTTSLSVGQGGTASTTLTLRIGQKVPPGPIFANLKASTTGQVLNVPINAGVMPGNAFFDTTFQSGFGTGFNPFAFGQLFVNPQVAAAGDSINISASGFTANSNVASLSIAGVSVTLPSGTTFDSTGFFSTTIKVPSLNAGKYPIRIADGTGRDAFADIQVIGGTATFSVSLSPEFLPPMQQGQTLAQSQEVIINIKALPSKTPGTLTLSLSGLTPGVTSFFDTGSGYGSSSTTATTSITTAGDRTQVGLKFAVASNTPPGPMPLFLKVSGTGGETFGAPLNTGVLPSAGLLTLFGVGNLDIVPDVGTTQDTVTVTASGFTAGNTVSINFGGVSITLPSTANTFDSNGFFSTTIKVPSTLSTGTYPVEVSDGTRKDVRPFTIVSGTQTFGINVSPQFMPPIQQGSTSSNVVITAKALSGKAPGTVTIEILGLPPGVTSTFDGTSATSKSVTVPTGGEATTTLQLSVSSSAPPGFYHVPLKATSGSESKFTDIGFGVRPSGAFATALGRLIITPEAGRVGDTLTIQAVGFTANSAITLQFGTTSISTTGQTFDSNGEFTTRIKVPSGLLPGFYPITISDASGKRDSRPFNVVGTSEALTMSVSPNFVPPVIQGGTSSKMVATISSTAGQSAGSVTFKVEGLSPDMSVKFDGTVDSDRTTTFTLGTGESRRIAVEVVTSAITPPRPYMLTFLAQTSSESVVRPVGFGVMPNIGAGQGFASVVVNPPAARPGDTITLAGTGFVASTTFSSISVIIPGSPTAVTVNLSGTVTVDSNGTWNTELQIPSGTAPGFYRMKVTSGTGANERTAEAPFHIIPATSAFFDVGLEPDFVKVTQGSSTDTTLAIKSSNGFSDNLTLKVSGLPPGMVVTAKNVATGATVATFTGTPRGTTVSGSTTITPEVGGTTSLALSVAASSSVPTGPYMIFVAVEKTGESRGEDLAVQVIPSTGASIIATPSFASSGDKVTVSGSGFTGSETITLKLGSLAGGTDFTVVPSTVQASSGSFSAVITIPSTTAGVYPLTATGGTSGTSATTQMMIRPTSTTGSVQLQIAPKFLILPKSSTATVTLTLNPLGSLSSAVTLTAAADSSVSGVTTSFSPSGAITLTPGIATPVTLTLTASGSATTGGTPKLFQITATSGGSTLVVEKFAVQVVESTGDFRLDAAPKDIVVLTSNSATSTVKVMAFGLSGTPTFQATGLPTGVTSQFTGATAIDSTTGISTATLTLTASSSASAGTTPFQISATVGSTTRTFSMSVSVVTTTPTSTTSGDFDPTSLNTQTPFRQTLDVSGSTFDPQITIDSISTTTSGATKLFTLVVPTSASGVGSLAAGTTSVGSNVINIEPSTAISTTQFDLCLPVPSTLPSGVTASNVKVAFLDTSQTPPVWTQLTTTVSGGLACVADVDHFSSWSLVAATPTTTPTTTVTPSGGGGGAVFIELPSTLPDSYFVTRPLERVNVQVTKVFDARGLAISQVVDSTGFTTSQAKIGQQLSIGSTFKNQQGKEQSFAYIVQVLDKDGFTVDLGWQIGKASAGQTISASRSWTPEETGLYTIKVFVWNGVGAPVPLSTTTSTFVSVK